MINSGYILYVPLALILWAFWTQVRGKTFEELLQKRGLEHHQVQALHRTHPHGGTWKELKLWLAFEKNGY